MGNYYFDIVEHYNKSISLVTDYDELLELARLNLIVAQKVKASTAYLPALQYFCNAAHCLQGFTEKSNDSLHFEIEKGKIECNFLLSNVDEGIAQADVLLKQCKSIADKVDVNNILILHYGGAGQMDQAIDIALDSLRYFGVNIPRDPSQVQLLIELARAKLNLGRKKSDELINMPVFEDKQLDIVFSLLKELVAPTYLQGLSTLLPYIILRMFNLTLKHGNSPVSSFVYSGYALLWAKLGDFSEAYRFGELAMQANERVDNPPMEARCYFMSTSFALYWGQPLKTIQEPRKTGLHKLLDTGEYFWASYINLFGFWQEAVLAKSVNELFDLTEREIQFAKKAKQIEPYYVHILHKNLFKNLAGETLQVDCLDIIEGDEAEAVAYFAGNHTSTTGVFYHAVCRLVLHYYREEYEQAVAIATQDFITDDVIKDGTYTRVIYTFFTCLSLLAIENSELTDNHKKRYKKGRKDLKKWYQLFAENFACPWNLLLAEEARIDKRYQQAIEFYEQAQLAAKKNDSILYESLSCELYARFWLSKGNQKIAATYMTEAGYLYYRWGAKGKLRLLKNNYGKLFSQAQSLSPGDGFNELLNHSITSVTDNDDPEALDLKTLVKASQALSSELVMDKLVQKLMHFLIENAGAQKGILILVEAGQLLVEAECLMEQEQVLLNQQSIALDEATNLPIAIVHYVVRSQEIVVLSNATQDEQFVMDPYFKKDPVKSVLCVPLVDKSKVTGALYLENNLTTDSFTPKRVEILKVLLAEMSIALENARLYRHLEESNQTLEEKVKERTEVLHAVNDTLLSKNKEIEQSKKIIEKSNDNITKSIQYAKKIQTAILPLDEKIAEILGDFFIIFKPKQIVSGDFYWLNNIQDRTFIIVADCTGHGVPGALLSMIGHSLLNKIIIENKVFSPACILEQLHVEIRSALRQEGNNHQTHDGMDIGICQIDVRKQKITYAAAKRPLYFFDLSTTETEHNLQKIPGNRKSIGGQQKEQKRTFSETEFQYSSGDMLYLSSDGLVDQHNQKDEKFGSLRLQALLKTLVNKELAMQKVFILEALSKHQGKEPQRDDITLFGVRLI
ncbi:MAG: SpoIIE family protein phosphatase [Methyloprofundus sp.]|nr:SpoIIE family protein phosphatase [Methyloprofundus sp.]